MKPRLRGARTRADLTHAMIVIGSCIARRYGIDFQVALAATNNSVAEPSNLQTNDGLIPATLLSANRAANTIGVSKKTLANWRTQGRCNLPFVKAGSRVLYRAADVANFIMTQTRTSTSHKGNNHA